MRRGGEGRGGGVILRSGAREPRGKVFLARDARSRSNEIKVVQTRGYSSFRGKKTLRVAGAIETFGCHRVE